MTSKIPFPMDALVCLLAACGRVGEDSRPPASASLERAQIPVEAAPAQPPASAPAAQPAASEQAKSPAAEALTDSAITSRVTAALASDPAMKGADVSINTDNGVVVLSGTVSSHEQSGVASAHAQRQDGVLRVDNHLRPAYS